MEGIRVDMVNSTIRRGYEVAMHFLAASLFCMGKFIEGRGCLTKHLSTVDNPVERILTWW
jgi:hypothetical protein